MIFLYNTSIIGCLCWSSQHHSNRVQQCTPTCVDMMDMMDMVLTCVDMVSNVVTPKATLAGTDRLSSQNETWRIFIPVCMTYWRNIKTLMLANLGNKSPMRQWRACKKGRRWWADNRRTPSWKPSGSETERPFWLCSTRAKAVKSKKWKKRGNKP